MKKFFTSFVLLFVLSVYCVGQGVIISPSNYKTMDNPVNLPTPTVPSSGADPQGQCWSMELARAKWGDSVYYYEVAPRASWWRNTSASFAMNGDYRQTSRLTGESINGNRATWIFDIDTSTSYIVYNYILSSGNAATSAYYFLDRFGESIHVDSFRHDFRKNNIAGYGKPGSPSVLNGVWVPLSIVELFKGNKTFSITLGADTLTGYVCIRADGIRILKSSQKGPDIEFGKRPRAFDSSRVEEEFGDVGLGNIYNKDISLYNIGNQELVINSVDFKMNTGRFSSTTPFPLKIAPGKAGILKVSFRPYQEEFAVDTLIINSNDPTEPKAMLGVSGTGINYYFIMNASNPTAAEPHYNAPYNNPLDPNRPTYTEGATDPAGNWLNSSASPYPYPIPGGNLKSRVNTSAAGFAWATYQFTLEPDKFGTYMLEWAGPYYSSNATSKCTTIVKTPLISDSATAIYSQELLADYWRQIGTTWQLTPGGPSSIMLWNVQDAVSAGAEYLRPDLLRIRKIPSKPTITSEYGLKTYYYGSISAYEKIRLQNPLSNKKEFIINSNGESLLRIDSIYFTAGWYYKISGAQKFPIEVPAVNGQYKFTVEFNPKVIFSGFVDTIKILTNADNYPTLFIRLYGSGVGDAVIADDADPVTYIYPPTPANFAASYLPENLNKWYWATGGTNDRRLLGRIYYIKGDPDLNDLDKKNLSYIEWFPTFPAKGDGSTAAKDSFDVYASLPAGSSNSSPAVKYVIYEWGGKPTVKIMSQNAYSATTNPNGVPASGELYLGRYQFMRNGSDSHGSALFGHVELWNDTSLVTEYYRGVNPNPAKQDTHYVRADAIIFREAALPGTTFTVEPSVPTSYSLSQNYPNPFNPTTNIKFSIADAGKVTIKVYDMLGREIRTIVNDQLRVGNYNIEWNGKNDQGNSVATGAYFYRIATDKYVKTMKMLLLK